MIIRRYDHQRDRAAMMRVHREVGWLGKEEEKEQQFDIFFQAGRGFVAEVAGAAECGVMMVDGRLRYLTRDLSFAAVAAVTTGRVARRQGLAGRTTATAIADAALRGDAVAGLSMFDQGFYNLLGFGTLGYEQSVTFDPATLRVPVRARPPVRVTVEDAAAAHECRLRRLRSHGGVNLLPPSVTQSAMGEAEHGFGLGYRSGERITHYFWADAKDEGGPYSVWWLAYENGAQLLELLGLLHDLSDQVQHVWLREPPQIQLQDLLQRPYRNREHTRRAQHEHHMLADAGCQVRILDLAACIAAVEARSELAFNLDLHDPIARFLPQDGWRGIAGEYRVRLGAEAGVEPGSDPDLPTLRASVGAFSRVWLGARPAVSAAITDDLSGPPELLAALDSALALPAPHFDWGF